MKLTSAFFLSLFLLTACSSLLPKGAVAPRAFTLNAPMASETAVAAPLPVNLQILLPQATPGLDSDHIILRRDDNRVDYYADVKWTSNLNTLVQSLLVESFDRTHQLKSVGNDLVAMNQNYSLLVEIRDFQAEYITGSTVPRAHIRMVAKLIRTEGNAIIATRNYEEKQTAESDDMSGIIRAFDQATQNALQKLVGDTVASLQTPPAKPLKK